jgi:hypothetical protein
LPSPDTQLRRSDAQLSYLRANRFEFLLGVLAIVAGATYFFADATRDSSSVARVTNGVLAAAWSVTYLIGGLAMCLGVSKRLIAFELAGLWLVTSAILVNAYGVLAQRGWVGLTVLPTFFVTIAVCVDRMLELRKQNDARDRD